MTDPALIEAAARAMPSFWDDDDKLGTARLVLTAVIPLIEAATLERAAKVAEEHTVDYRCINGHDRCDGMGDRDCPYCERGSDCAAAIRALKEQP